MERITALGNWTNNSISIGFMTFWNIKK